MERCPTASPVPKSTEGTARFPASLASAMAIQWRAMDITLIPTKLTGVVVIESHFSKDSRGFFIESYHRERFHENGIDYEFVQDNHSRSARGVLRGLHYQDQRAPMAKLVRCTLGNILDVAVDLRPSSPSFGRWISVELSEDNKRQLLVPVGFGHGFLTLSEFADVQYKCSNYYRPETEGVVKWDDPELEIDWGIQDPTLSSRDTNGMSFADYRQNPAFA